MQRRTNMRQVHTNAAGDWLANLESEPKKEPFEDPIEFPAHLTAAEEFSSEELSPPPA